jgi:glycine/D-amino acid oxidase-like deaminating enzyme
MNTTAHVTCVTDLNLTELDKNFGRDHAQAVWDAGLAAIDQIDTIVREEVIACGWKWVTGYKHVAIGVTGKELEAETARLRDEAQLALEMGFEAEFMDEIPWLDRPGVGYEGQARIHPGKYVARLASLVDGDGSFVFQETTCHGRRPHAALQQYRARDAHAAHGQDQPRERHAAPDEAVPLHLLRRWRTRAVGDPSRRPVLGYGGSVPVHQNRSPRGS